MCNFAAATDLFLTNTKFKQMKFHKITWMRPESDTGNQIDNLAVKRQYHSDKKYNIIQRSYH